MNYHAYTSIQYFEVLQVVFAKRVHPPCTPSRVSRTRKMTCLYAISSCSKSSGESPGVHSDRAKCRASMASTFREQPFKGQLSASLSDRVIQYWPKSLQKTDLLFGKIALSCASNCCCSLTDRLTSLSFQAQSAFPPLTVREQSL